MSYIKKRYKSSHLLFLSAACVGQGIVDQVEASVDEAISSGTWVDIAVCSLFLRVLFLPGLVKWQLNVAVLVFA